MKPLFKAIAAASITLTAGYVAAFQPAVVYDTAGKFDKSFNEAVFRNGVEPFNADKGVVVREFEPQNEEQRTQSLRRLAQQGASPIVAVGFNFSSSVEQVAAQFPNTQFAIIDSVVDLPNVQSIIFAEHEGSFLVGALAAMATESNVISFVGGMDIPLIRKFACGYEQGAKYVNSDVRYIQNMTGSTPSAFNDPARGSELANSQITQGSDVIFAAAGGTGIGVYQAAADAGVYAIGVDSNQNYLQPGTMLSSMVKRVGVAAYQTWEESLNGEWEGGIKVLDLAAGGVDWALDEFNEDLVSAEMQSRMAEIRQAIIDGEIQVHDYSSNNSCDY
ncbi:MAG: BMP family ABC transporter substrate-binding protein [Saccharospirillum sp.]|nr:BMP family ABC transporter substrate-binding protein [Saccharospirillum sp.]